MSLLNMGGDTEIENIKAFGQRVAKMRKDKKLSLEMLANMADIDLSGLHRIETGKTNPKLSTVFSLAKALEILPKELFDFGIEGTDQG